MVVYEIFIRSFRNSSGDGIGDLRGIIQALDHIQSVGADAVWLTPIFPSPSFHGYDPTDLFSVNPVYGSVQDLKELAGELHSRSMKLILDLPLHHTSVLHPWFSERPELYIWASPQDDLNERRPWDGGFVWHRDPRGHYRGFFGPCTADLNYENPKVLKEAKKVIEFWKGMGVDGFRVDAAKHFFKDHGRNVELLRELGFGDESVLEVWDEPEVVGSYAEVSGVFNFSVWGALKASIAERSPQHLYHALIKTSSLLKRLWHFLSSHDTSRICSEIGEEGALFALSVISTLPGNLVVYYGDEICMKGIYDPHHPEDVSDPFPWCESMCCRGTALWKSPRHNLPHSGSSLQRRGEFLERFKEIIRVRKERGFCEGEIEELEMRGRILRYEIKGVEVIQDFSSLKTEMRRG